jgi:DNA primase
MPRLQENSEALAWLGKRGISSQTADRFGLGWLGHDFRVRREMIGLSPRNGKPELWVPGGLLIAIYDDNRIHRLRVRRTDQARGKFLPDLKYVWLEGSGNEPMVIRPAGKIRGAVIIEAELDAIATAAAHDQVLVIAIGSVSTGLPASLRAELEALPVILVALDADPAKDGKTGAGPKWISRWQNGFRQAKFWPVPEGKDPGHYAELGGNLRLWIEAGLVPELPLPAASHEQPLSPVCVTSGDGGKEFIAERVAAIERIAGLKWCSVCLGDKFLHGDAGGYFCVECQPVNKPGRLVLATVPRGEYVVD